MSSHRERRRSSLSVEQKIGARVSDRYWPMQQMLGKDRHGQPITQEVYVDMRSGLSSGEKEIYVPPEGTGWNSAPPNLASGDPGREGSGRVSQRYRDRYDTIDWSR